MIDLNNFSEKVQELIFYSDDVEGNRIFRKIKKEDEKLIQEDRVSFSSFLALQFLIIPFLSTKKISELFKEKIVWGLRVEDIDIKERVNKKMLFLSSLNDRDNCKKTLKKALELNNEIITSEASNQSGGKINKVSDWIRDYIRNTSKSEGVSLSEAKYFFQSPNYVKLRNSEKELVKKLLNLYKFVSLSSFTPDGFEDDLLLKDESGRLITTKKGRIIVLHDPREKKVKRLVSDAKESISAKTATKKQEIQINKQVDSVSSAKKINTARLPRTNDLKEMAAKYPEGSLERKAIEDEIRRIEGGN